MVNTLILMLAAVSPADRAAAQVVETELAFAADTAKRGGAYSFRSFVAPNAVGMFPNPETKVLEKVDARQRLESRPLPPAPVPAQVKWWPAVVGVAGSGELAFTSGPVTFLKNGTYGFVFTVWERQPDGSWKYYFDGGPKTDGPSVFRPTEPARRIAAATARSKTPAAAEAEVARAEAGISRQAGRDLAAAYRPFLTTYTQMMGSGGQPTFGQADATKELARRGKTIAFEPLGSRSAKSGDFVFTYGRAVVDGSKQGGYTRIWQNSRAGWKLVLDQVQVP
jgi:hypothetical protein